MPKGENLIPSSVFSGAQFLKSAENVNVLRQRENKPVGAVTNSELNCEK